MDESHVAATLKLLEGMQKGHLMAVNVKVDESSVILEGISQWNPVDIHPSANSPVFDGLGEGPDD